MARYDVVLLPTFSQVEDWRKRAADQGAPGIFHQTVTTFNAWLADLWELHGDGRAIVDTLQRMTIMQAAFGKLAQSGGSPRGPQGLSDSSGQSDPYNLDGRLAPLLEWDDAQVSASLVLSPGVVKMAAKCTSEASGLVAFESAVQKACAGAVADGLVAREALLLRGVGCYYELLRQAGLVELGHVASYLSENAASVFARPLNVLAAEAAPPNWVMQQFFDSCPQLHLDVRLAAGSGGLQREPEGVDVGFAFPAGRYAQPGLVVDLVDKALEPCRTPAANAEPIAIIVACKDPLGQYKQCEPALAARRLDVCVVAQLPFHETDFGRQFLQVCRVSEEATWAKEDLADAVRPPFSGFNAAQAIAIDKELRANRIAQRDDCLARLRVASDAFSQLEELAADPEADILLGVFEQVAFTAPGRSAAWRAEQLSAASALRACTAAARRVGASMQDCVRVLEDVKVTVSYEGKRHDAAPARGRVVFTTQACASRMGAASCDMLVICDLTSEDYPVADKDDAAATLFGKMGLVSTDPALARARRTFVALQALPRRSFVCMRPLNDWGGNPTYPSAALQEFIDSYRADVTSEDDVDEVFGLPDDLRAHVVQRGEELLFANEAAQTVYAVQDVVSAPLPDPGDPIASGERGKVALARRAFDGRVVAGFSPSPSQVEAYLECPRKWFSQNRLAVEDLDEGFGPLERGSFSHAALQGFYRAFLDAGYEKVADQNLDQAKKLMRSVLDGLESQQAGLQPGSGRYVATNRIEQREIEVCKDNLVSYLDFEARLLPGFRPKYLEYEFKPEDGIEYAGCPFIGVVDRIDVDDAGNAVVIDYKGSLNAAHEIAGKGPTLPGKVQTRMYAQVVKRALGLNVVGALYVSYGKKHACAGAYDARALEAADLPGMKHEKCGCVAGERGFLLQEAPGFALSLLEQDIGFEQLSFAEVLDCTEELVKLAIKQMQAGVVAPHPASSDACAYCPVQYCAKRGA